MDSTNHRENDRRNERRREQSQKPSGGLAERAANKAISAEADVKRDMGPAVSNTYVAENMTVTNNYNF